MPCAGCGSNCHCLTGKCGLICNCVLTQPYTCRVTGEQHTVLSPSGTSLGSHGCGGF